MKAVKLATRFLMGNTIEDQRGETQLDSHDVCSLR